MAKQDKHKSLSVDSKFSEAARLGSTAGAAMVEVEVASIGNEGAEGRASSQQAQSIAQGALGQSRGRDFMGKK
ncbi:MAG: hypothetical protein BJG00_002045 [Limnothrix sp. CACIAM 69d]|nr:MAG: hypothetical protein BJG00_002045 [Limnothrix sp. CACIAM 69d]